MPMWSRWALVLVLVVAVVIAVFAWPKPQPQGLDLALASPASCTPCHPAVAAEFAKDRHACSRTDPEMDQMQINKNFTPLDCNLCHAPRPVFESLGRTPARRDDVPAWPVTQGVDCYSCHYTPEGMASADSRFAGDARPDAKTAPCRPIYRPELAQVTHCASCHNQHKTVDQWRATRYGQEHSPDFRTCQDCHMPEVEGPATVGGTGTRHRTHRTVGGHAPALVRRGAVPTARKEGDRVVVEIDTRASAHNFPTDYRTRFGLLVVEAIDDTDRTVAELGREKWRQPFRNEPGGSDPSGNTQIAGDTVHTRSYPLNGHAGPVRVRLFYSLRPYTDVERPNDATDDTIVGGTMFKAHEIIVP